VYSPGFVPGLTVSGDVWRIYLTQRIGVVGPQGVINQCFFGQTQFCRFITRAVGGVNAGRPLHIFAPAANLGRIDVKGLDFSGHYRLPHLSFGQFTVSANLTYMDKFEVQTAPGLPSNRVFEAAGRMGWQGSALGGVCPAPGAGEMCFYPRWRGEANVSWQRGPWSALWALHYIGRFRMANTVKGRNAQGIDVYGSNTYSDITLGYNIAAINTRVNLGADNVFNRKPPLLFDNRSLNANTAPAIFDTIGRFYWLRATVTF
jgi:outer membrane receptor protein involved in Fe transport